MEVGIHKWWASLKGLSLSECGSALVEYTVVLSFAGVTAISMATTPVFNALVDDGPIAQDNASQLTVTPGTNLLAIRDDDGALGSDSFRMEQVANGLRSRYRSSGGSANNCYTLHQVTSSGIDCTGPALEVRRYDDQVAGSPCNTTPANPVQCRTNALALHSGVSGKCESWVWCEFEPGNPNTTFNVFEAGESIGTTCLAANCQS